MAGTWKKLAFENDIVSVVNAEGLSLASGKAINFLSALTSDGHSSGLTEWETAGEALTFGQAVYMKSDGKVWKAKADDAATMPCVGLSLGNVDAEAAVQVLRFGSIRSDAWAWTAGARLYVSDATAGSMTETAPESNAQEVAVARTATVIEFHAHDIQVSEGAFNTSGSYAGDNTVNRAIPHGLGTIPSAVFLLAAGSVRLLSIIVGNAQIYCVGTANTRYAVTAIDSTNFYVGNATNYYNSANGTGETYYWVALL